MKRKPRLQWIFFFFIRSCGFVFCMNFFFYNGYFSIFLISFIVIFSFSFSLHILLYCSVDDVEEISFFSTRFSLARGPRYGWGTSVRSWSDISFNSLTMRRHSLPQTWAVQWLTVWSLHVTHSFIPSTHSLVLSSVTKGVLHSPLRAELELV